MRSNGHRLYAIGDIHGCRDEFALMRAAIAADLAAHPHTNALAITLGDYVDRGADSAGVLDDLIAWHAGPLPIVSLRGNHDIFLGQYLDDPLMPQRHAVHWLDPRLGGDKTLLSYGVDGASPEAAQAVHRAAQAAIPQAHLDFITQTCRLSHRVGDYLFVHAGVNPARPLDDQAPEELVWIREPFLSHQGDLGAIVVHGHTPVRAVELHANRIALDTGAVFGGVLSCVVIEGGQRAVLQPARHAGRLPLAPV